MENITAIGQSLAKTVGRVTVGLQWVREGAYQVTVVQGGTLRIEQLCASYTTEAEARQIARGYVLALRAGASVERIIELDQIKRAAAPLLDLTPLGKHREIRPTMAGAQLANLSEAQERLLLLAACRDNHTVYAGEFTRPVLRAIDRKGYGTVNYRTGMGLRRVIESITVNARGVREAARISGAVVR